MGSADIRTVVKRTYGEAALRVIGGGNACCSTSGSGCGDAITSKLYDGAPAAQVPVEALVASLG